MINKYIFDTRTTIKRERKEECLKLMVKMVSPPELMPSIQLTICMTMFKDRITIIITIIISKCEMKILKDIKKQFFGNLFVASIGN